MLDQLIGFATALRAAGVECSQSELLDATATLGVIDLIDREQVRDSLRASMIKDPSHIPAFDRLFEVFFGLIPNDYDSDDDAEVDLFGEIEAADDLAQMIADALADGDDERLRKLVRMAVTRFGGIEAGRAVSGIYYTYRTLRQLDSEKVLMLLSQTEDGAAGELERRLSANDAARKVDRLKSEVSREVLSRLVEDRGAEAVARTLAVTLPEDIEIVRASRDELAQMQRAVDPLARKLASRLAKRHRRQVNPDVDMRRTMRASLSYGGVPVELVTKPPKPHKPEIFLVSDVSGSVASFARFTMQLVFAMSSQFSKVRSFAFIDAVDEVTSYFNSAPDINEAMKLVNTKAKVVWLDGHSDYGRSLETFYEKYGKDLTKRSSVIICGDARNNYHPPKAETLRKIQSAAKHVYWLNPEPKSYWDSGDSIISSYEPYCDGVFEVRSLRQLERFVSDAI